MLIVIAVVAVLARGVLFGGAHPGPMFVWNDAFNMALAVLATPFALFTVRQKSDAPDRMMADMSYIVYLLHWPAIQPLGLVGGSLTHRLPFVALTWAVVLPASWVIWRFYDRPINAARARWVAARVLSATAPVEREVSAP